MFPAGDPHPVRVEFAGDEIESIRRFESATQRSMATLDQVTIFPLRERFERSTADATLDRGATLLDYAAWSGAGPSVIAFAGEDSLDAVGEAMGEVLGDGGDVRELGIDRQGVRIE